MSNPTIVIIPGAWHQPSHYQKLIDALRDSNYDVVSDRLPSAGSSSPKDQSAAKDAAHIRTKLLNPLLDQGKEILLIMHSYGGCPGADAAKGLSKAERKAAGNSGGIIGLIFMCAVLANDGDSLISKQPNRQHAAFVNHDAQTAQLTVSDPKSVFYHDVDDDTAEKAISQLLLQAEPALSSPSGPPAWADAVFNGKRAYIQCEKDQAIPPIAQEMMVQHSGVEWDVKKLNSSHSPFLSHTLDLANLIIEKAKAYA